MSYPAKVDGVSGAQEAEWQTNKSDSIQHVLAVHACLSAIFQPPVHQKHHQSLMDRSCLMFNDYRMDDVKREEDKEGCFFCHCDHIVKNVKNLHGRKVQK